MTDLTVQPALPAILLDAAAGYAAQAASVRTATEYTSDMRHYSAWCGQHGLTAVPAHPQQVGAYLAAYAPTLSVATLERRLSALCAAHRQAGHQLDTKHAGVAAVFAGIKRQHGTAQKRVAAATTDVVKAMIETCDGSLTGLRDRALLLLGFAGAFRRSELVALEVSDLHFEREGLRIAIRRSKTDQEALGAEVGIAVPAVVAALQAWLEAAGIGAGAVFRSIDRHGNVGADLSDKAVALVVKKRAEAAGLDASQFSGHSLRAGCITTMAMAGVADRDIQKISRHADVATMHGYIRTGSAWINNATGALGL